MKKKKEKLTELDLKKKEMNELVSLIALNQGLCISKEKEEELRNWEARLEFRRKKLEEEYAIKEIEMRIEIFKEILSVLKSKKYVF